MKESDFLKNFAKAFGAEDAFQQLEEKKLKEKRMLESLGARFGVNLEKEEEKEVPVTLIQQPTPVVIIEDDRPVEEEIVPEPEVEPEVIEENVIPVMPDIPVDTIVTKSVEKIAKAAPKDVQKVVDEIPGAMRRELDAVKKSITDLHRFSQRHSQMGGGGEVRLLRLDDVNASTVADGYYLRYDEATRMLVFDVPAGGNGGITQVQSDWTEANVASKAYIKNKPSFLTTETDTLDTVTTRGNVTNNSIVTGSVIPNSNLVSTLGNTTNRWESLWVGGNSVTFTDQIAGYPDQKLTLANGIFYIAIANTTQQSNAGFRVGNFYLYDNTIQLTDSNATFYIGSTLATGNLVINRPVIMRSPDTGNVTFSVSRTGRVQIYAPSIPLGDVGALSIIGSSDGSYQNVAGAGGMLHITGNDNLAGKVTLDGFGNTIVTTGAASITGRGARGTASSPLNIANGDVIFRMSAIGYAQTNFLSINTGGSPHSIEFQAAEDFVVNSTATRIGSRINFYTSPVGQAQRTLSLTVDTGGITTNNANLHSITANGSVGTNGQVLASNGTGIYWSNNTGAAGANGVGITNTSINGSGNLVITYSNTTVVDVGHVVGNTGATGASGSNGSNGTNGANGVSVTSANVNSNGYLIITYSNTATANAGYVVGPAGANGSNVSQIQTDWNQSNVSATDFIKNKPTIPTNLDSLTDVTISGPLNNQVLTYNTATSQWINQNNTTNNYTTGYYGGFVFVGANVALSNTANAYIVPLTSSQGASGISLGTNNDIVIAHTGTYEIVYSIQYENDGNDDDYADVWIRKNGVNLDDTNSIFAVNRKNNGGHPGDIIAVTPFQLALDAGDKIQVMTSSSTGNIKIITVPAQTNPTVPRTPGVIVNVTQVASVVIPTDITGTANNASYLNGVAANQYAYANGSNLGTLSSLRVSGSVNFGSNSFAKTTSTGDVTADNGTTDTPGLLMYYANNNNWGVDSWNGSFNILSGQLYRITNNLNESGGAVKMAIDTTGNMVTTGFILPGAYRAGQVIKDTMLSNTDFSVLATTVATSTSDTDFISYNYTPVSSSSYLIIHVHVGAYDALTGSGGGSDSYFSRIKIDGGEITYGRQATVASNSFRTGTLFPLIGRYTNSNTAAKAITVGVRRDSADDSITIVNSATALWMRITEIAR